MEKMVVLKLDGEIWECRPGWGTDENSIGGVQPIKPSSTASHDVNARAKGITHRQTMYGGTSCHEVKRIN